MHRNSSYALQFSLHETDVLSPNKNIIYMNDYLTYYVR